ncbi:glycosyltransferase [Marinobacter sp. NSM]|uniref:glycosyltransferase n=1 Tax=Marinobacter sp. NSM TaxID=3458004 RepID=UPI0040357015
MDILIVYASSGRGLRKDALILESALNSLGHNCQVDPLPPTPEWQNQLSHYRYQLLSKYLPKPFRRLYYALRNGIAKSISGQSKSDLVIHLENPRISQLRRGKRHWLIPNQEWFIESRIPYLQSIDRILCKTQHAAEIFSRCHSDVLHIGFTGGSAISGPCTSDKNYRLALHVAGNSQFKGTTAVLSCWSRHPEWPKLVVVSQHVDSSDYPHQNIEIRSNLTDKEMKALWQEAGFAILPSEVEGYGQVLAEALENGCVTITTNAPPMNELIDKSRGYLVEPNNTRTFRLGTRYMISEQSLDTTINTAINETQETLERTSANAEQWYSSNHKAFIENLRVAVSDLVEQPADKYSR